MTKWQRITIAVMLGATVLLIGYDVLAVVYGGKDATISVLTTWASSRYPAIAFAWGFLMGHFFGQNRVAGGKP